MSILARKNLFHDRVRLVVTLTGIVFALVLIVVQFGLFMGFLDTSANVVAQNKADLWIAARGIPHVNGGAPLDERIRYKILSVPRVEKAVKYAIFFVVWKLPTGASETVQIVGYDLDSALGGPWNVAAGSVDALRGQDTIIVDDLYKERLGVHGIGDQVEIGGHRARVVGLTHGIRSFTTTPYIFTSFKNAQNYARLREDQTIYILIQGSARKADIEARVPEVDVFTNQEMLHKTQFYWVFSTGAGITTLIGAVLGLLVGIVVVAQTIYAATVDHIREFGTLKAMGAKNGYIYRVIIEQALISAVLGYSMAIGISYLVVRGSEGGGAAILLTTEMIWGTLLLAMGMCVVASVISIRKVTTLDPAMVFRG